MAACSGDSAEDDAGRHCPSISPAPTSSTALFGQIEDLIKDKHLLIVPSGPLTASRSRC